MALEDYTLRQTEEIVEYIRDVYGDEPEFLWSTSQNSKNAIWRVPQNRKWYAAILIVGRDKLGLKGEEKVEILDVMAEPAFIADVVDHEKYFEGYHMNKKHWLTVKLDGSLSTATICNLIDNSHKIAEMKRKD